MFRSIRPIYFLVYGQEALEIFKELTLRVERDHPELAGLHYGAVFIDGGAGGTTGGAPAADAFLDPEGKIFPIESIDVGDLAKARAASARARTHLCNPKHALEASAKDWEVSEESPIFVLLVDNADGGCPDWVEICQQIRSEWSNLENGLQQSFSVLLGPRLKAGFDGIRTSDAFCGSAEAFLLLVRGGRHPGDTGAKEWLPQMVAVDGRLEDGGSVQPEEEEAEGGESVESKDLCRNLVDLIYGLVGLTLTDQSALGFFSREVCRTAGLVTIGLPIQGLLSEHRCEWLERYSKGMLGEKHPDSEVQGEEEARKWLSESHLGRGEDILGEKLKGKITYTAKEEKQGPFSGPEFVEKLREEIKKFWDSRVELVPGHIEANRQELLEGFEDRLVAKIGGWLDGGRSPEEITNILEMIRGSRGGGLAGHTKGVDDLRSRKWDKVRSLEHLKPSIDPDRAAEYERLQKKLDLLLAEEMDSAGTEAVASDDSEASKTAQARREKLQRKKDVELDTLLPAGEKDETLRERIGRVQDYLASSKGESAAEKKARKKIYRLQTEAAALQSSLEDKRNELSAYANDELEGEIEELESEIFKLQSNADVLKNEWGFISLEGWAGTARTKTLPSGEGCVVANSDDERAARQELNRCLRDLGNRKADLENEPENPIVDGEIIRRKALEEKIRVLKGKEKALRAGWEVARRSLEDWQADLESAVEQQAMVKRIRQSLEDQVCISVGCAARFVNQIKKLTGRLRAKKNELKSFRDKSLLRGGIIVGVVALVVFLASTYQDWLIDWLPGPKYWCVVGLPAIIALALYIRYLLKTAAMRRQIAKLKRQLAGVETKLARWSKETEFLFNTAADDRVTVEAMFAAIKAIDYSLEKVEKVQDGFEGFVTNVRQSLEEEQSKVDIQSELPKTRALYSIMGRKQLDSLFLTDGVRAEDERLLQKFKKSWSRSRLWGNYYDEGRSLEEWKDDLYTAADDAHGIIRDFNLEECLRNNPSILKLGGEELKYIGDSTLPLAELTGIERGSEENRSFAACGTDKEDFGALGKRLDQVWPGPGGWTKVESGIISEASLLVLRPNIQTRRIEYIQGGIQGLLEKPWGKDSKALSALGGNLDAFFNISSYAVLAARTTGSKRGRPLCEYLVSLLPNLICSEVWEYDQETGVFRYGDFSLGRSISEMLCRLARVGLFGEEREWLQGMIDKDSRARLKDSFAAKMDPVDRLFEGDLKNLERDLYKCWVEARDKALDKIQSSAQPRSPQPQPSSGESRGSEDQQPESREAEPDTEAESDPEPKVPEAPEADSEPAYIEEPEPDIEPDSDPGDDPEPSDSQAEDSE